MSLLNQSSCEPEEQASAARALARSFLLRAFHTICCFLSLLAFARSAQSQAPEFQLVDRTKQSGLEFRHFDGDNGNKYLVQFMSAGMASLDFDCDGMTDVLALNGCKLPVAAEEAEEGTANRLFRNLGGLQFVTADIALPSLPNQFSLGVSVADYDGDGFADIYISNFGVNCLLRNNGDGSFIDVTEHAGVGDGQKFGAGVVFLDADSDGDLDLFVANYVDFNFERHAKLLPAAVPFPPGPKDFPPTSDSLFVNDGSGRFRDQSELSGIRETSGPSMGAVAADFDDDGDTDISVACDGAPNRYYQNEGNGDFLEAALLVGVAVDVLGLPNGSMGVDAGDLDQDLSSDLFVTDYTDQFPMLFQNSAGLFLDSTRRSRAGIELRPHVNWSVGLVDLDCDSDKDAFICNGHFLKNASELTSLTAFDAPNTVLENMGNLRFRSIGKLVGKALETAQSSRSAVFEDFDHDGDIDIAVLNCSQSSQFLENTLDGQNHWLQLNLVGNTSNRDAVGARVTVETESGQQRGEKRSGRGYQGHFGSRLHFGLGKAESITRCTIVWPDGSEQVVDDIAVDQILTVVQP